LVPIRYVKCQVALNHILAYLPIFRYPLNGV